MTFFDPNTNTKTLFSKNEISRVEGLAEARLGDASKLNIVAVLASSKTGVWVKQFSHEEQSFVAAIPVELTSTGLKKISDIGVTGLLVATDPFNIPACETGEYFYKSTFRAQTALFELKLCPTREAGETTGYNVEEVAVTDSSSKLNLDQQKTVKIGKADIDKIQFSKVQNPLAKLKFTNNHHNACEQLYVDVGFAAYAFTTPPVAGCFNPENNPIPEAPERDLFTDTNRNVIYKTRYLDEPWSNVTNLDCGHYMFFCETQK